MRHSTQTPEKSVFEQALHNLGVTEHSLTPEQRNALDIEGYIVLRQAFAPADTARLQELFDHTFAEQRPAASPQKETGTRHLKDLHQIEAFWRVCANPRILAAAFHVLKRRFICAMPHGREPLQGFGQQGLHMDWSSGGSGGVYFVATAICLLDDFTKDNGATRVVPGSHRYARLPGKRVADPSFIHPQQVVVEAPAGSALVFNGHLLHSGARNLSGSRRRTLQFAFMAEDARNALADPGERAQVTDPALRCLFGYGEDD